MNHTRVNSRKLGEYISQAIREIQYHGGTRIERISNSTDNLNVWFKRTAQGKWTMTVYSYSTVIAVYNVSDDVYFYTLTYHSHTTQRHRSIIARALPEHNLASRRKASVHADVLEKIADAIVRGQPLRVEVGPAF